MNGDLESDTFKFRYSPSHSPLNQVAGVRGVSTSVVPPRLNKYSNVTLTDRPRVPGRPSVGSKVTTKDSSFLLDHRNVQQVFGPYTPLRTSVRVPGDITRDGKPDLHVDPRDEPQTLSVCRPPSSLSLTWTIPFACPSP